MKTSIKNIIASELSNFLLKEAVEPESIKIEIQYAGTTAKLYIDTEKLKERK